MPKSGGPTPVRGRAFALGLILILVNCYWTVYLEAIWYAWPTDAVPFSTVIVLIFFVSLVNAHLSKHRPRLALNYGELITVYVMASLSSAIANWNMLAGAVPVAGHAYWFATPENDWRRLIWRHLPSWLTVNDPAVLRDYYGGGSTFFSLRHMAGWAPSILAWTMFSTALFGSMALLCVLLRKQWTERERLTFPVVQMPLQLMNAESGFFRSRLMWIGFGLSATVILVNAIHFYFPAAPHIPVKRQHIDHLFAQKPWDAITPIKISFYPFMIGLGFLMPLDLCFSAWFFYLLGKAQLVGITAAGVRLSGRYPYFREQSFGAVIAVCAMIFWVGREHFRQALRDLFTVGGGRTSRAADAGEAVTYRTAFIGIALCFAFLLAFCIRMGMSAWFAVAYLLIMYILAIVITRVRAELGMPVHDFEGLEPRTTLLTITGTARAGARNLTPVALLLWSETGDYNPHPMPHHLEGLHMMARAGGNRRQFLIAILLAVVVSSVLCFVAALDMYYDIGATTGRDAGVMTRWYGETPYARLQSQLTHPTDPDIPAVAFMGLGAVVGFALMTLRMRFIWWPFHTLGYILASSWAMYNLWTCVLISWALKLIIIRQGGLKAYRRSLPFFWGLILGDFVVGGALLAVAVIFDVQVYIFYL
jgi:hypothetical protein